MKTILFQGDSITDADRKRDDISNYGYGYPNIVAAKYLEEINGELFLQNPNNNYYIGRYSVSSLTLKLYKTKNQ